MRFLLSFILPVGRSRATAWRAAWGAFFSLLLVQGACAEVQSPLRILMQWTPQAQFAGFIMAHEKGFFREAGLPEVQLLWSKLGDKPLTRLCAGDAEFATAWLATGLLRRIDGLDLVNIGQYMQKSATMILARADRGIQKPEDLTGKVLLSWGGDFDSEFKMFLERFQITPKAVFPLSSSLAPMLQGAVDATQAMYYNEYRSLLDRGLREEELVKFAFADIGLNFVGDGLFTTARYRDEHPQTCAAVQAAVIKGWAYAFAHEEETLDAVLRYVKANLLVAFKEHQRWMLQAVKELVTHGVGPDPADWGRLRREDYDAVVSMLQEQGHDVSSLPYETVYRPVSVR